MYNIKTMSTGNNIETEYLELNEKQKWTVHYQVVLLNNYIFVCNISANCTSH